MKKKTAKNPIYTADQIFAVSKLLEQVYNLYPATTRCEKTLRSIAFDLEEKFSAKRRQLIKKNSLFEADLKHNIALKFHEQDALVQIINSFINTVNDVKPKNDLLIVLVYLDEKLA